MSHAADERRALADALLAAGPTAPTLCEGWTALDLAAHVVAREQRPDSLPGIMIPPLASWTERVRRSYASRPFESLVASIRSGPGRLTWAAVPGLDAAANLQEFFIHTEDARRSLPGWSPRSLSPALESALWTGLRRTARLMFRSAGVGVTLEDTLAGRRAVASSGTPSVTLRGAPSELLLYASGRRAHARVDLDGPPDALARLQAAHLGL